MKTVWITTRPTRKSSCIHQENVLILEPSRKTKTPMCAAARKSSTQSLSCNTKTEKKKNKQTGNTLFLELTVPKIVLKKQRSCKKNSGYFGDKNC